MGRSAGVALISLWLAAAPGRPAVAQLVSPGRLAEPHSEVAGLRKCTMCHTLGQRGVDNESCLACHEPLRNRTARGAGLHARYLSKNCGECHKDHFGEDFELVRFEPAGFEHADSGYELRGSHEGLDCRECHQPPYIVDETVARWKGERGALRTTYLGLGPECTACHSRDDPHEGQFAPRGCLDCHTEVTWEGAGEFEHGTTRYRLTGRHREIACGDCHRPSRRSGGMRFTDYSDIEFEGCTSCHLDSHEGSMGDECEGCHRTSGWREIADPSFEDEFDHGKTGYALAGAHESIDCAACHAAEPNDSQIHMTYRHGTEHFTYPRPLAENCQSCHRDYHEGGLAERPVGAACDGCHGEIAWLPTSFGIARHNRDTAYELTGAHVATPCLGCHFSPELGQDALTFAISSQDCLSCHRRDNPHGDQFEGDPCASCHVTESFEAVEFDHSDTRFPLDGEHIGVPCVACHEQVRQPDGSVRTRFTPVGTACADCH